MEEPVSHGRKDRSRLAWTGRKGGNGMDGTGPDQFGVDRQDRNSQGGPEWSCSERNGLAMLSRTGGDGAGPLGLEPARHGRSNAERISGAGS